jgi:hypothetical protein
MVKVLLIILVIAVLLEDGSSIKKTEEEKKEDEELAKAVNATLAAEEKKKKEEDQRKKKDGTKIKKQDEDKRNEANQKDQDEACPICNCTCPIVPPCLEINRTGQCGTCPDVKPCGPCPGEKPCKPCEECPEAVECGPCPTVKPCRPCSVANCTEEAEPTVCQCPEGSGGMTVPVAMAVGAVVTLTITGVATVIGLLLRYAPPIFSGLLFIAIVVLTWYLSSHYPETARELGGRVVTTLREAAIALGHRVVEAIQRHNEQVGFPVLVLFFLLSDLSSMFPIEKVCTKIFYVEEN